MEELLKQVNQKEESNNARDSSLEKQTALINPQKEQQEGNKKGGMAEVTAN